MADITYDFLKEPSPIIDFRIHLNKIYAFYNKRDSCVSELNSPQILDIVITMYKEGTDELIDENIEDVFYHQISLVGRSSIIEEDGYPDSHFKMDVINRRYIFKFRTGIFWEQSEGSPVYYSQPRTIILDNRNPVLGAFKMDSVFYGAIRDRIENHKPLNIFYGQDYNPGWEKGDLVNKADIVTPISSVFRWQEISNRINYSTQPPSFEMTIPDHTYTSFMTAFFTDRDFAQTVNDYFKNNIPTEIETMPLVLKTGVNIGTNSYRIFLTADFPKLLDDYRLTEENTTQGNENDRP